jgi:protein-S-isoprenylcysteine O-methyltransferase Ste14
MADILRLILPIYFLLYFAIAFVLKSVLTARRTGRNPLVLPKDDSAYGLIGRYFKITLVILFLYVLVYAFFPDWHGHLLPLRQLELAAVAHTGLALLLLSFVWTVIAQAQMKDSWRIGIDTVVKTELVTDGLFSVSRNPIFLGMIVSLAGLFLCTPNAMTAFFLILGYVLIQIQIRLEEEFLAREHGQKYADYRQKVRRLLGRANA